MEEDGGSQRETPSRLETDVSRGAARAPQEGEDAVCQGCRTEFQHRDVQGRESNREAAANRLRARGFKRHAHRRPVLSGGTYPRTNNGPDLI